MDARRLAYLEAMGIDAFDLRDAVPAAPGVAPPQEILAVAGPAPVPPPSSPGRFSSSPEAAVPAPRSARAPAAPEPLMARVAKTSHPAGALDWEALAHEVSGCRRCGLCETRTRTVFGAGDRAARWMVVGEAPGADEDQQGEPFVGRAGQLLNAMLKACGLERDEVFIANVLKCRPPNNRDPEPPEVAECLPYLMNQIELVNPGLILCLGRVAARNLLGTDAPLGKLRGQLHRVGPRQWPVVVTYHPAYLLRAPAEKRKAWDDLQFAMAQVAPRPAAP
ncbi:MAG: uracil-DNA glycosylase family protein [Gammaproteobacteria bacterium]